jgi:hypothetical protein
VQSKYVGTTRRVITSTWPGDTGNESKITKARSFAQSHSASGSPKKGEGDAELASGRTAAVYEPPGQPWSGVEFLWLSTTHPLDAAHEQAYIPSRWRHGFGGTAMASVSLRDLGLDRLSIEERLQIADAI